MTNICLIHINNSLDVQELREFLAPLKLHEYNVIVVPVNDNTKIDRPGGSHWYFLKSGFFLLVPAESRALFGFCTPYLSRLPLPKAGFKRHLGRRPHVRGVAMNPVDHPHGGGEGKGAPGRPSVSPWGYLTKCGYKK